MMYLLEPMTIDGREFRGGVQAEASVTGGTMPYHISVDMPCYPVGAMGRTVGEAARRLAETLLVVYDILSDMPLDVRNEADRATLQELKRSF